MANIGSSEWFTDAADKLLDFGLDVLRYKTSVPSTGTQTSAQPTTSTSGFEGKLPYILGAVAVGGIVLIMLKR